MARKSTSAEPSGLSAELPLKPPPDEQEPLSTTDYRTGVKVFTVVAVASGVGYFFAWGPLQYVLAGVSVVCLIRAIVCLVHVRKGH